MAKKQKCPEFENHERWLVSYADMVTLLFAVFVVLYANLMAGKESSPQQVTGSMQESFNTPLEDIPVERRYGPGEHGWGIFENMRGNSVRPQLSIKYPGHTAQIKIIDGEMKQVQKQLDDRLYGAKKFRDKDKTGQERIVSVERTTKGFKLQLTARHFFDSGSYKIKKKARKELAAVVDIVKELGRPVTIMGHTDSTPATGKFTNWEISALRATDVVKYMVRKHNFPTTKLSVAGYADLKPIAHNGTAAGRSMNRRIEVHIDYIDEMVPQ